MRASIGKIAHPPKSKMLYKIHTRPFLVHRGKFATVNENNSKTPKFKSLKKSYYYLKTFASCRPGRANPSIRFRVRAIEASMEALLEASKSGDVDELAKSLRTAADVSHRDG